MNNSINLNDQIYDAYVIHYKDLVENILSIEKISGENFTKCQIDAEDKIQYILKNNLKKKDRYYTDCYINVETSSIYYLIAQSVTYKKAFKLRENALRSCVMQSPKT